MINDEIRKMYGQCIPRSLILPEAKTWLGVKYTPYGRSKDGTDCVGLPICIAEKFGVIIEERLNYSLSPDGTLQQKVEKYLDKIEYKDLKVGDIVMFSISNEPCHLAIVSELNPLYVIHALDELRHKVIETRISGFSIWEQRVEGYYRYKNILEDEENTGEIL